MKNFLLGAVLIPVFFFAEMYVIIFKPSHAHFIFTAPINPKVILLMGAMKNFLLGAVLIPVFFFAEMYVFQIGFFKAFLLSVVVFLLETILEGSLIIFLYALYSFLQRCMCSKLDFSKLSYYQLLYFF